MIDYSEQLKRIKAKLPIAQKADESLKVFGAKYHKYVLHKPVSEQEIFEFEELYSISLPDCYKSFLLHIGNGGIGYEDSGAGPHLGIYPFGTNVNELTYSKSNSQLKRECIIFPKISDEYWAPIIEKLDNDDLSEDEYDEEREKIYGGILPIGNQGCTYLHGIVLNGPHKGKVVNFDGNGQRPLFCFENNFLDWYERWLDEIISEELIRERAGSFGYRMGGPDKEILEKFLSSIDKEEREDCLEGILNKKNIEASTITAIERQILQNEDGLKKLHIKILCKFSHERAKPYLIELAKTDLLSVFQFIFYHARDRSPEWLTFIEANIHRINDPEIFRFCVYLLEESNSNYRNLVLPFAQHNNMEIRDIVTHTLEKLNKRPFTKFFR